MVYTGVQLTRPVAGVACGLMTRLDTETGDILEYQILTDIAVSAYAHTCKCTCSTIFSVF